MLHPSVTPLRERKKHGWMAQKMCSKDNAYLREGLEEIKNCHIKEEDAWNHFFVEINNDYIEEEITRIRTLA